MRCFARKLRFILAVLAAKIVIFAGRLVHKGTSLPGEIALKICPDLLARIRLPEITVAITGSNGKTSTAEMITAVYENGGKRVLNNKEGSNQLAGVATLLLKKAKPNGLLPCDCLVLECDERYAKHIFRYIHPSHFIITNLYRDQLTRNGHPFFVYDRLKEAADEIPGAKLLLNADDLILCRLGLDRENVAYFGMARNSLSSERTRARYEDCARCPVCGAPMDYAYYHYAHLGDFACGGCGYRRTKPDYEVTAADFENRQITLNGETIHLAFESRYNVYNVCAAFAVCAETGVSPAAAARVLSDFVQKRGRRVRLKAGENEGMLLISKHENSVAYNMNLEYVSMRKTPCRLAVVVDSISRKYYTAETSWLWDISFEYLKGSSVKEVLLCGKYAYDLAVRFEIMDLGDIRVRVLPDLDDMAEALKAPGAPPFYVTTCFSDKDKIFARIQALSPTAK